MVAERHIQKLIDYISSIDNLYLFREDIRALVIENKNITENKYNKAIRARRGEKWVKKTKETYDKAKTILWISGISLTGISYFLNMDLFITSISFLIATMALEATLRTVSIDILSYKKINPREDIIDILYKESWNKIISKNPVVLAGLILGGTFMDLSPLSYQIAVDSNFFIESINEEEKEGS